MAAITYLHPDGSARTVDAAPGTSVMRAALSNDIDGIVGECGGQAMCATCHVYVEQGPELPSPGEDEEEMLDCTAAPRQPQSRLGCQIMAGNDFDSLTVRLPGQQ